MSDNPRFVATVEAASVAEHTAYHCTLIDIYEGKHSIRLGARGESGNTVYMHGTTDELLDVANTLIRLAQEIQRGDHE